jgi:protein-S-isoprenylcysteine O-methyltransferase Ste14
VYHHPVRTAFIAITIAFLPVGLYYRIRSLRSGEKLDRRKEGLPIMIGLRLTGLATVGSAFWLGRGSLFARVALPVPEWIRWIGVIGYALGVAWLIWMFISLGTNLTDTVVTRRDAHFVDHGPYRYVRNPMYTGILVGGVSLGLALGPWLLPLAVAVIFTILAIRTRTEEKYLIERFGDQYRNYMKRVGRFFPRLT